jgi:uncharacterized membrane protein YeaQ/YmgE (transglycosylase-associated protein family)
MGIVAFIVIGVVAGLIARALVPGNQNMGLIATAILGVVGSFVGGLIATLFRSNGRALDLHPTGLLFSVIGAMAVLMLVGLANGRRHLHA